MSARAGWHAIMSLEGMTALPVASPRSVMELFMPFFDDGRISLRYQFRAGGDPAGPVLVLIHEMGGAL